MTSDDELGDRIRRLAAHLPIREAPGPPIAQPRSRRLAVMIGLGVAACAIGVAIAVFVNRAEAPRISTVPPTPSTPTVPSTSADPTSLVPLTTATGPINTVAPTTVATTASTEAAPTTLAPTTSSTTAPTTTAIPTTSGIPPPVDLGEVTLPIIDSDFCSATWGRVLAGGARTGAEFERLSSQPIAIQVIGETSGSLTQPFALVERFFADQRLPEGFTSDVDVNGIPALVESADDTGSVGVTWRLADDSEAYLRTHGLSRDETVALARSLTPRPTSSAVPGFDVEPGNDLGIDVIDETNGDIVDPAQATSECRLGNGSTITVSLIDPYTVARAAFMIGRAAGQTLAVQDLPDGRLLVLSGRGEASLGWNDVDEYADEAVNKIRQATPQQWAELVRYPMPGELDSLDLPVDAEAQTALADRTFDINEIGQALIDILQPRVAPADAPDTVFNVTRLLESPRLVVTMNYLDDSVVAAQWLVELELQPDGAFTVTSVRMAIKCRDGSAHPPGEAECA